MQCTSTTVCIQSAVIVLLLLFAQESPLCKCFFMTMSILHNLCCKKVLICFLAFGMIFYTTLTKCKGKGKLGKKKVTNEHSFVTYGSCAKILRIPCHFLQLTEKRYITLRYVSRSTHKTLWNHKPKEKQREWALTKESFHLQIFFFVFFAIAPLTADANKRKKRQKREESGGETNGRTRKIPQGRKLYKFIKLIGIAFEG